MRERLVQVMFEKFNVSGFYATEQAVLSLYAAGRISGCTVDIGHGKIGVFKRCLLLIAKLLSVFTFYSYVRIVILQ